MKIDHARHFAGESSLPPAFRGPGPHELTFEQLAELTKDHAVLLYKIDNGKIVNGKIVIAFDDCFNYNPDLDEALNSGDGTYKDMKIDHAWHFAGEPSLPPAFRGPGPHELTLEQLVELMKDHAVLLYKIDNGKTAIAFDSHRGRFKPR